MKVFGTPFSPFVRKVLIVARLKGVSVDFVMTRPHADDPDFKAASPFGLVPAIDDNGFRLSDSSAIVLYMERRYPSPPLMPGDPKDYGRALWFEEFADSILGKACGAYAFAKIFTPFLFKKPVDEEKVKKYGEEDVPAVLDYLETVTPDAGFLIGSEFGIADAAVISTLMALTLASFDVDVKCWPKVASYMKRAFAHSAVIPTKERMTNMMKDMGIS